MLPGRNRDLPPIAASVASSNGRNAPVAWTDEDHVLPILTTSGPFPELVAARTWFCKSDRGTTWRLTLMPVCWVNLASSGVSTCLSLSKLVPWLLAQYVKVTPALALL